MMEYFNFFRYNKKKIKKGENMLADYHIHCKYSDDSEEKPEKIIKTAIDKGINEICFTDHVDYGTKLDKEVFEKMSENGKKKLEELI